MTEGAGGDAGGALAREGLSVVVMAYNEAESLSAVVDEVHGAAASLGAPFEVLIVDDGSTDGTSGEADRLAGELDDVRVVHHVPNRGLGGVYRTGFSEARGAFLTFFPADGQFPAEILTRFHPLMADQDMVLGYLPDRRVSLVGSVLSAGERALLRALFGRLPRFQGIFMLRRSVLDELTLVSDGRGWAIVMELIIRVARGGYRTRSEPTALRARMAGVSKVQNARTIASNLRQVLALRGRMRAADRGAGQGAEHAS